jgi:hypothetical protein
MKLKLEASTSIEFEYDQNLPEFITALKSYREAINPGGDIDEMLKHVAYNILRFGDDHFIEGVGYVAVEGSIQGAPFSGISVNSTYNDFLI